MGAAFAGYYHSEETVMHQRTRRLIVGAGLVCLGVGVQAASAADISPATAANMARNCFGCHGPDGRSPGAIPGLNGKNADYIVKALADFRSGARPSTVMGRHAKGYSDAETQALAKYISSLK
jgi:sulfide dehydrogenase cytochrome subunit